MFGNTTMKTITILVDLKPLTNAKRTDVIHGYDNIIDHNTTRIFSLGYSGIWVFRVTMENRMKVWTEVYLFSQESNVSYVWMEN